MHIRCILDAIYMQARLTNQKLDQQMQYRCNSDAIEIQFRCKSDAMGMHLITSKLDQNINQKLDQQIKTMIKKWINRSKSGCNFDVM